ncbi:MAG: HlyD family efflux transporter periplasmic adaptor subunit [Bacteroidales bacterium]|jgi:HlyD family secretion protein|nr:HlyD family efflux transporter periplasmic adaptor subunit [Bacteroidales bacterium]HOU01217.1 HlyD family efflux transporter periplasmic adaptor subunit [Bacteroidales bacterium]HQK67180.1 HlyD family efflux transporter periplasmic adaptor subunit [Bacteroidales bacterium]
MKIRTLMLIGAVMLAGCNKNDNQADAYGNFEATEVVVSSETSGRILQFNVSEGVDIDEGNIIALIDTTLFHLQKAEIDAGMRSIRTRINSINAQNDILDQQIANLNVNIARIGNMLKDEAATQKQYDDLAGQLAVLQKQIAANNTQKASIAAELSVYESKKATVNEQLLRSTVRSPLKGTVLEKYSEAGEITAAGKPLVKIADLSVIRLKAYVSGTQLGSIKIGQECSVRIDDGRKEYQTFTGKISYIADKAEFTPKIIQTKEERVTLVYAVLIDVINDGSIKSGMPGEAIFDKV